MWISVTWRTLALVLFLYETTGELFDTQYALDKGDLPLLNRKAIGAMRRDITEHPYVVNIMRKQGHFLVGTIISDNVVITVAEPLHTVSTDELSICCGQTYFDRGAFLHTVVLMLTHEKFSAQTLENDIALLRTYHRIEFRTEVKLIPIFSSDRDIDGRKGFVSGWARCDFTGNELCLPRENIYHKGEIKDPILRTAYVPIPEPNYFCKVGYERQNVPLRPGMMCAGEAREENQMAACLAAPGAPLVVDGFLVGVLSWGLGCGYQFDLPLVYTDLRKFEDWIGLNAYTLMNSCNQSSMKILYDMTVKSQMKMAFGANFSGGPVIEYSETSAAEFDAISTQFFNAVTADVRDLLPPSDVLSSLKNKFNANKIKLNMKFKKENKKLMLHYDKSTFKKKLFGKTTFDSSTEEESELTD